MKVQFNVQLPRPVADRLRSDARRSGRKLDDVATVIFKDFLSAFSVTEREKFYAGAAPKRYGRPISEPAS